MRGKALVPWVGMLLLVCTSCGVKQFKETVKGWFGDETPKRLETRRLSLFEYEDKLMGAWAGKMIGVSYAAPYEFQYLGKIMEEGVIRPWKPEYIDNALQQDDLYVQMTFLQAIEEKGLQITSREAADYFAKTNYPLWHANDAGRRNIRAGIYPPDSGHPRYNPHANDIDFQIEADVFGILCPGLPRMALALAESFGAIMNYGDGVYGGYFVAGMYSAAYFGNDRMAVIEEGLKCIPSESQYALLIRDVLEYYRNNPADWQGCWKMLEDKWGNTDLCPEGYRQPFNIDAKMNGGYVAIGLLFGEGDFVKTLEIATRCGQDNDCNASTAAGVLGAMNGYSRIPQQYKSRIPLIADRVFLHTKYNFTTLIQTCRQLTTRIVERFGGTIQRLGDREYYAIPIQKAVKPPRLVQFTEAMRDGYRAEWANLDAMRLERLQGVLKAELSRWSPGWTISNCGNEMNPGLRNRYADRFDVFVTHPQDQNTPCVLSWSGKLTEEQTQLLLIVAASDWDPLADWVLRVRINGNVLAEETVALEAGRVKWHEFRYDLSAYVGQDIALQLENAADEWSGEAAFWGKIEFVKQKPS